MIEREYERERESMIDRSKRVRYRVWESKVEIYFYAQTISICSCRLPNFISSLSIAMHTLSFVCFLWRDCFHIFLKYINLSMKYINTLGACYRIW